MERRRPLKRWSEVEQPSLMKGELPLDREQVSPWVIFWLLGLGKSLSGHRLWGAWEQGSDFPVSGVYGDLDKVHLAVTFMENHLGVTAESEH